MSNQLAQPTAAERARAAEIVARLRAAYPDARTSLNFTTPLELLVATMLSAQCTDERVNAVTVRLFQKYRSAADYANAAPEELEQDIKQTGFYHNKAKHIRAAAQMLVERFGGEVPKTMAELTSLPGVARKTANVVMGNAYGIVEGTGLAGLFAPAHLSWAGGVPACRSLPNRANHPAGRAGRADSGAHRAARRSR